MKVEVFSQKAKKVSDLEVSDSIFGSKVNPKVLAQYLYIYLSNQRESNANTKVKSEVRGGGKKPHAQKGTGRARAGSSRSPLWRGGGVTFGPTNQINWKKKITKSFRASAFRNILSKLTEDKLLKFIDTVEIKGDDKFTKQALEIVENFGNAKKMTIITNEKNVNLIKAFSNLEKKRVVLVSDLNVYDLMNGGEILIEEKALEYINKLAK